MAPISLLMRCTSKMLFSVVSLVYQELQALLATRRNDNETYRNFETCFAAQLARFNALGISVALSQWMAAIFMLGTSLDDLVESLQFETIASTIRQCDEHVTTLHARLQLVQGATA